MSRKLLLTLLVIPALLVGCGKVVKPSESDSAKVRQYNTITEKASDQESAKHGKQTGFWYGALSGVESTNANGVGFLRRYEDGYFEAIVNLNIKQAEKGNVHVAWLTNAERTKFVRIAELNSIIGDTRHTASADIKDDLSTLTNIVVSYEATGTPDKPGILIEAEGSLREVSQPVK
jgi:hypothetical protein